MGLLGVGGGVAPGAITPGEGQQYSGQLESALASQPEVFYQQAQASPWWGIGGQFAGGLGRGLGGG